MVKTPIIKQEGQALTIPNEKADEMPITLSYSQARALAKQLRPPPSEKQKEHVAKLVEANKLKWQQLKEQKEAQVKQQEEELQKTTTRIVVKPKRIYKPKVAEPKEQIEYVEVEEEEEDEEEEQVVVKAKTRPKQKLKQEVKSESDDDEIIQKTTKAKKLLETVSKLDSTIDRLKQTGNKYDQILNNKLRF